MSTMATSMTSRADLFDTHTFNVFHCFSVVSYVESNTCFHNIITLFLRTPKCYKSQQGMLLWCDMPATWLYFLQQLYKSTVICQPTEVLVEAILCYGVPACSY